MDKGVFIVLLQVHNSAIFFRTLQSLLSNLCVEWGGMYGGGREWSHGYVLGREVKGNSAGRHFTLENKPAISGD